MASAGNYWFSNVASARLLAIGSVLVSFVAINVFAGLALSNVRLDATESRNFTLDNATLSLLERIEEPITIVFFRSNLLWAIDPKLASYAERVQLFLTTLVKAAGDKIKLERREPAPFSSDEDEALAMGLEPIPLDASTENAYFALAATDSIDRLATIEQLDPSREDLLATDIRRLLGELIFSEKPRVQLVTDIPIVIEPGQPGKSWRIVDDLERLYQLEPLPGDRSGLGKDAQGVWLVEPTNLTPAQVDALETFVGNGGGVLVFIEPIGPVESALGTWLADRGLTLSHQDTAPEDDQRSFTDLGSEDISETSSITQRLSKIRLRGPAFVEVDEERAGDVDRLFFEPRDGSNPADLEQERRALAVSMQDGPGQLMVVADVDMLREEVWSPTSDVGPPAGSGRPGAENSRFLIAALDHLTGRAASLEDSEQTIGRRPFTRFDAVRRDATEQSRSSELDLLREIDRLEEELTERLGSNTETSMIEAFEDQTSTAALQAELLDARLRLREIRRVQLDQIETLEQRLVFFNVAFVPIVVGAVSLLVLVFRWLYFRSRHEAISG
ncbi:MAG: GldG family protein [Pseudomonadota bacterium]